MTTLSNCPLKSAAPIRLATSVVQRNTKVNAFPLGSIPPPPSTRRLAGAAGNACHFPSKQTLAGLSWCTEALT